jgi:putative transposase
LGSVLRRFDSPMASTSQTWSRSQDVAQPQWELARARARVLQRLAERPILAAAAIDDAAKQLNLSRSSIYRLLARYRSRPQITSLLPKKRGRREDSRCLDELKERILNQAVQEFFLRRERPRISDLLLTIRTACQEHNLEPPHYRTVTRRIKALDPMVIAAKRFGTRKAQNLFEPVHCSHLDVFLKLERVQIDHTLVDVVIVDENRQPIGRPWLGLAVDVASKTVMGLYVSLDAPSILSVAMVLAHAVLPKENWLAERSLDVSWPVAGIPDLLHLDNGPEFDSASLVRGAQEYGIEIEHRPVMKPHFGGHIERLIGTVMGAVHLLPGTTFSNSTEKADYPSESTARLTLSELERWLTLQIAGVYHHSVHSALHRPPMDAWQDGLGRRSNAPRLPSDHEQFFRDFLPGELRLVRRDGIRLFNIHYWDNVLTALSAHSKRKFVVKYDPRNLSHIYFQDREGAYWPIPYRDLRLPPISLWEHREAMKALKAKGRKDINEKLIFDSIVEQRNILERSRKTLRQRRDAERSKRAEKQPLVSVPGTQDVAEQDYSHLLPFKVEQW